VTLGRLIGEGVKAALDSDEVSPMFKSTVLRAACVAMLTLCAFAPSACGEALAQPPPSTAEGLVELEQAMFAAVQKGDRAALGQLLGESFELRSPHTPPTGKREFIERVGREASLLVSVEGQQLQTRMLGNLGIVSGWRRSLVRFPGADGLVDRQAFFHVAERASGRWKLVLAFETPDPG